MPKRFSVEFPANSERDFELIFGHLYESYRSFGESPEEAVSHAERRVLRIREFSNRLGTAPHRGTTHNDILPGLRHLTAERAIYWSEVDDTEQRVRVLAIFFGGQDHVRHMLARLLR